MSALFEKFHEKYGKRYDVVLVTPKIAEEYLEHNTNNRKPFWNTIVNYAKDMVNGNWRFGNTMICFDENEVLTDGQNRLLAIIKSGVPQVMMVAVGVEPNPEMDRGRKRTIKDNLEIFTNIPKKILSTHVISMMKYILYLFDSHDNTMSSLIKIFTENEKYLLKYVSEVKTNCKRGGGLNKAPIRAAFFLALANGVDPVVVERCRETLNTKYCYYEDEKETPERYLPMKVMSDWIDTLNKNDKTLNLEIFFRIMHAIHCVEKNKVYRRKPRDIDYTVYYDISFNGEMLSDRIKQIKG